MKKIKLTKLDRRILYELDINARISLQQLGRKTGASRERVHYRINRLEREGVITGYRTIINSHRLGYESFRVYLKLRNVDMEKEQEIIAYLADSPVVGWLVSVAGGWDINMWVMVKEATHFTDFLRDLEKRYKHYLSKVWVSVFYRITQYPKNFLIERPRAHDEGMEFISPEAEESYDTKDLKILAALSENGRRSLLKVAEKAGLGTQQTKARIRSLEERGIILGYRAVIDHTRFGYTYYKMILWLKDWSEEQVSRILGYAKQHPHLFYIDEVVNGGDVELEFLTEGKEEMQAILEEFRQRFAETIATYEMQEYPQQHKLVFLPVMESMLDDEQE